MDISSDAIAFSDVPQKKTLSEKILDKYGEENFYTGFWIEGITVAYPLFLTVFTVAFDMTLWVYKIIAIATTLIIITLIALSIIVRKTVSELRKEEQKNISVLMQQLDKNGQKIERFKLSIEETKSLLNAIYSETHECVKRSSPFQLGVCYHYIAQGIYGFLRAAHGHSNFSVSIFEKSKSSIKMVAHRSEDVTGNPPKIFNVKLKKQDARKYYFGKMLFDWAPRTKVLSTNSEIVENFYFPNDESPTKSRYTQYIGIPVCHNQKAIALIEIVVFDNNVIAEGNTSLQRYSKEHLEIFGVLLLFAHTYCNIQQNPQVSIPIERGDSFEK